MAYNINTLVADNPGGGKKNSIPKPIGSRVGKALSNIASQVQNQVRAEVTPKTISSSKPIPARSLSSTSTSGSRSYSSSGGGGGGGGNAVQSGPTDAEKKAAANQTAISKQNIRDVQAQLARQLANYDLADKQNKALSDAEIRQYQRKSSEDRFEAQRDLQAASLGLFGTMGTAMNGNTIGNFMDMLRKRNDKENNTNWSQFQVNRDQALNTLNDSINRNVVARRDAMQNAEKSIRDIESAWRANLNNINPELFPGASGPVGGDKALASSTVWKPDKAKENLAKIAGYVMPDQAIRATPARNRISGNDYFAQLMNRFNGR